MRNDDSDLKISQFIKEPKSLKLLILASTNIKIPQLNTVSQCIGLIKLDLSSNMLPQIPLNFAEFPSLKVLYLHDNQLTAKIGVKNTYLKYLTAFDNPIQNYRVTIIENNSKLLALDFNVITSKQRQTLCTPSEYTKMQWPIVQSTTNLENEDDYLNLLKAQLFVVNNVYKRATSIEIVIKYLETYRQQKLYSILEKQKEVKIDKIQQFMVQAYFRWKKFTIKRKKLRRILNRINKEHLINNIRQINFKKRSPSVSLVLQRFIASIRHRMTARVILQRNVRCFRNSIFVQQNLRQAYKQPYSQPFHNKLYFLISEEYYYSKIFLYLKKQLFKNKQYDLCDDFDKLVRPVKNYYIFRLKAKLKGQKSFLLSSIHNTAGLVITDVKTDKQNLLYNKKGHKKIQIKPIYSKIQINYEKINLTTKKINHLYARYDNLVQYQFKNQKLFDDCLKILRYFNAGNSSTILSTHAAYFQTQINSQQNKQSNQNVTIFVGLQFFMKRVLAANCIQKFWRRKLSEKNNPINVIKIIRMNRAHLLINKWFRNIIFQHRRMLNKTTSFEKSLWQHKDLFIHLEVYMGMVHPTDWLRLYENNIQQMPNNIQQMYSLLHSHTQVQMVQAWNHRWVKIKFSSHQVAYKCYCTLRILTYRYYFNGFYIRLFTYKQIQQNNFKQYQYKIKKLFKIDIKYNSNLSQYSKIIIDNSNALFIWNDPSKIMDKSIYHAEVSKMIVSIFIYNKQKWPLKVNCKINWSNIQSIYPWKKKQNNDKNLAVLLKPVQSNQNKQFYLHKNSTKIKTRHYSLKHSSLLKSHRSRNRGASEHIQMQLLSSTLNIHRK